MRISGRPISRTVFFWIFLTITSIAGGIFSYKYFPEALSLINVSITMSRTEALDKAKKMAFKNNWGPKEFKQAAAFDLEEQTRNFIELEGGGKDKLQNVLKSDFYSLYTWVVRHFKEGETNEVYLWFTPEGKPYGLYEKIPEARKGAALSKSEAQKIAEKEITSSQWNIDLKPYKIVESSQEVRSRKRVDHTFVYERTDQKIGKAPYRLKVVVSGDKVTLIKPFVKIPETFTRKYQNMRAANDTIAQVGTIAFLLLYIFGCALFGLYFLAGPRWILWRKPLFFGFFVSFLTFLNNLNKWPLLWMQYNTSLSILSFKFSLLQSFFINFLIYFVVITLIFAAAETLTRKAFGHQIQFWKIWKPSIASSRQVLGRTLGGYLFIGIEFAYVIGFYLLALHQFGWWSPSGELIDPNILATYFPWLYSVSQSFQAGFVEECVFRAIPLATAALLGKKFGKQKWWIFGALILQAFIFGAAHANYPAQPAYARVIELILPSLVWGLVYLSFGLLPVVIVHVIYDAILMSLPLFVSDQWVNQVIVIIYCFIPLLVLLYGFLQERSVKELSYKFYNAMWQPPKETIRKKEKLISQSITFKSWIGRILIILGLLSGFIWYIYSPFKQDGMAISFDRTQAERIAQEEWKEMGVLLETPPWNQLSFVKVEKDAQNIFVWRSGDKKLYNDLLGTYLFPAYWKVRYAQFEGDLEERAEEYATSIAGNANILKMSHVLPEDQPGKNLSKENAREIVAQALKEKFDTSIVDLQEVSAESQKKPNRTDWVFIFKVKDIISHEKNESGQARIVIAISGDKVSNYYRYVFVPEKWQREYIQESTIKRIIGLSSILLLILLYVLGGFLISRRVQRFNFSWRMFIVFLIGFAFRFILQVINQWPEVEAQFLTSKPYFTQVFTHLLSQLVVLIIFSIGLASIAGILFSIPPYYKAKISSIKKILVGFSGACILEGITKLIRFYIPSREPIWADYSSFSAYFPILAEVLTSVFKYFTVLFLILGIFKIVDIFSHGFQKKQVLWSIIILLIGFVFAGLSFESLTYSGVTGLVFGVIFLLGYYFAIRYNQSIIATFVAGLFTFSIIEQITYNSWPGVITAQIISLICIWAAALWSMKELERKHD